MPRSTKSLLFILLAVFVACTKKQAAPPAPIYPVIDTPHLSLDYTPRQFISHIDTFYGPWEESGGNPDAGYSYVYISYYAANCLKFSSSPFGSSSNYGSSYLIHNGSIINDSGQYTFGNTSWWGVSSEYNFKIKRDTITCTFSQPLDYHETFYLHGTFTGHRIH